jgi:excinuclease ABC subunit B
MLSPEQIVREIKRLEAQMYKHARNLEFEEAAKIRDTIEKLKQQELGLEVHPQFRDRAGGAGHQKS